MFVDCSRELASFHSFLSASGAIGCIGWLAVLAIVAGASGAVIRPMVESYSKQKRFITDASHEMCIRDSLVATRLGKLLHKAGNELAVAVGQEVELSLIHI